MTTSPVCPHCGEGVSAKDLECPSCGGRVRYKTKKEAYGWCGMGLFDLIPGIRALPTPVRVLLLIIVLVGVYLFFELVYVPWRVR